MKNKKKHIFFLIFFILITCFSVFIYFFNKNNENSLSFYFPLEWFYVVNVYLGLYIFYLKNYQNKSELSKKNEKLSVKLKKIFINKSFLIFFVVMIISFSFIIFKINNFLTVDEPRWIDTSENRLIEDENEIEVETYYQAVSKSHIKKTYDRSGAYWNAYFSGDFKSTFNQANPSATLNFLHLTGYFFKNSSFKTYLFFSRILIVLHNLFLVFCIYIFSKKIWNEKIALIIGISFLLLPSFVGYSQIINHDSFQGLYVISFILALYLGILNDNKKYFAFSGIFYALAVFTQYKSAFLTPLLILFPIIIQYLKNDKKNYLKIYIKNLFIFFVWALIIGFMVLPAILFFPNLVWTRFFIYPKLAMPILGSMVLFIYFYLKPNHLKFIIDKVKKFEPWVVRFFIGIILFVLLMVFFKTGYIHEHVINVYPLSSLIDAILGSFDVLVYSLPEYLVLILFAWLIYYLVKPKIDLNFVLMVLFIFTITLGVSQSKRVVDEVVNFSIFGSRYLYVYLGIFIVSLGSFFKYNFFNKKKYFYGILSVIVFLGIFNLVFAGPFYIFDNNILLPKGFIITKTAWARDTGVAGEFFSENFTDKDLKIYSSRGRLSNFVGENVEVLPWSSNFWEENPDYVVVSWEKTHRYEKIFDYYRENELPLWQFKLNGVVFSGIYKFNSEVDYVGILNEE